MEKKLTKKEEQEKLLVSHWYNQFNKSMVAKNGYTQKWLDYFDAYNGKYFKNVTLPEYKSDLVSNYVFSTIETVKPIMIDNDPKFQAIPMQPEGSVYANDLQEILLYEWDREDMSCKVIDELTNVLVTGNAIFFCRWDSDAREIKAVPVNPFNIFPDPLATNFDDAEYVIYATYVNEEVLRRAYPEQAKKLKGGAVKHSELVNNNDENGNVTNQVLVLEVWCKDYTTSPFLDDEGNEVFERKYPRGRVITCAPEFGVLLSDKENPYKDGKFPFTLIKDYSIPGKFWGQGEVEQLLSPQKYMNELSNSIIDNAKTTANAPWIIDSNSGIAKGSIKSRPGQIIRKNPGTEVRREQPSPIPMYVQQTVSEMKGDIEQISGVFNSVKGQSETGVYTAQGILALQEAGQARIRLKVKNLENGLAKLAKMWVSRIAQYWKDDRYFAIGMPDGEYDLKKFRTDILDKKEYTIKISAGSTMPVSRSSMLDLMIRLSQTQMPDGQPLVDREAVMFYLPEEVKAPMMKRMQGNQMNVEQQLQQIMEQMQQMQQMVQQSTEQLTQQIQQVDQEGDAVDEQIMGGLDELAKGIEDVNKKILQLEKEHDNIRKTQEREKIKAEGYNEGYNDAETLIAQYPMEYLDEYRKSKMKDELPIDEEAVLPETTLDAPPGETTQAEELPIPEDLLDSISGMTDEELQVLMMQNPELADLIEGL